VGRNHLKIELDLKILKKAPKLIQKEYSYLYFNIKVALHSESTNSAVYISEYFFRMVRVLMDARHPAASDSRLR
jgi:hypothetical protein